MEANQILMTDDRETNSSSKSCVVCGKGTLLAVGIFLILLGVLAASLLGVYRSKEDTKILRGRFGIIFDAGGSGTRMAVYEYTNNKMKELEYIKCENKGLAKFVGRENEIAAPLNVCLEKAEKQIPLQVESATPIYMSGTAGMRLLNESSSKNIWKTVRGILNNGSFLVKMVGTLPGKKEAAYSWTTINSLLQTKQNTSGLLELGSTSLQLSFESHTPATIPSAHKDEVKFHGKKYNIYAQSYLCFGATEFIKKYRAFVIKESNFSSTVEDPCLFQGYNATVQSSIWKEACVRMLVDDKGMTAYGTTSYTLVGTSNYTQCLSTIKKMHNESLCTKDECKENDFLQEHAAGLFTAIGGGVYFSSSFLNISQPTTLTSYVNATMTLCSYTFQRLKKMKSFTDFAVNYCLNDVYNYYIMNDILKLGGKGTVQFKRKINGERLVWTVGSMLNHVDEMSPVLVERSRKISSLVFNLFIVVSVLFIIIGFVLMVRSRDYFSKEWKTNKSNNNIV